MSEEFRTHFFERGNAYACTDRRGTTYCIIAPDMATAIRGYKRKFEVVTEEEPKTVQYVGNVIMTEGCDVPLPAKKK